MDSVDAVQLLRNDHHVATGLFRQFEAETSRSTGMKSGVVREICMLLEVHDRLEREMFYPALKDVPEASLLIAGALEDHERMKRMIQEIKNRDPREETFDSLMSELILVAETHFSAEERDLFPVAKVALGSRAASLGNEMARSKRALEAAPQYDDSRPAVVQDPQGGEQRRKTSGAA